jgi:hypothetical protein
VCLPVNLEDDGYNMIHTHDDKSAFILAGRSCSQSKLRRVILHQHVDLQFWLACLCLSVALLPPVLLWAPPLMPLLASV